VKTDRKYMSIRHLRQFISAGITALSVCILLGSCASTPPPAAASDLRLTPEEQTRKLTLTASDQRRIRKTLVELAAGHIPVSPPGPALLGVRWRDVPLAMFYAAAEVEMAIARTVVQADSYAFSLRTVDDRPGRIVVRRTGDDTVYEARASIGRFDDDIAASEALAAAFDRQMRAFGRKRQLAHDGDYVD